MNRGHAQDDPAEDPAAGQSGDAGKAADPFEKQKSTKAKAKTEAAAAAEPERFQQVVQVVEFIETRHADWSSWSRAHPGSPDGDALRAVVQQWIDAGDATVLASQMVIARSGQRAKVESIRELIYPTEVDPAQFQPSAPFPVAFETRNLGMTLELDPVIDDDRIHVNMAPSWVRLRADCLPRPEPSGAVIEGDVLMPMMERIQSANQIVVSPGRWKLFDVGMAWSEDADLFGEALDFNKTVLTFSRSAIHHSESPTTPPGGEEKRTTGFVKFEWIDVDAPSATRWLGQEDLGQWVGGDGEDGGRGVVQEAIEEGAATLVATQMMPFRSGQRAKSETGREVMYATEFERGEQGSLSNPSAWETRNTGMTVEVDPVYSADGMVVDLNLAPEMVALVGQTVSKRYFNADEEQWLPDVVMPVFFTNKVTTQVTLIIDHPLLVAVFMPHDAEGQPDADRRRLLFITASH